MTRISIGELRSLGVSEEDIALARTTQEAQRRTGSLVQSIGALVGLVRPRSSSELLISTWN